MSDGVDLARARGRGWSPLQPEGGSQQAAHASLPVARGPPAVLGANAWRLWRADPKIRIYDSGMKKYGVDAFPHCVHLVRCVAAG